RRDAAAERSPGAVFPLGTAEYALVPYLREDAVRQVGEDAVAVEKTPLALDVDNPPLTQARPAAAGGSTAPRTAVTSPSPSGRPSQRCEGAGHPRPHHGRLQTDC